MSEHTGNKYLLVFKNTILIGSGYLIKLLVTIIGYKFAALFLGTDGMGLWSTLKSILAIIFSLTSFGIGITAVREISLIDLEKDYKKLHDKFSLFDSIAVLTGLLGSIVCLLLSRYLSLWTFGSESRYTLFFWLGGYFLISTLISVRASVLQGLQLYKLQIKINTLGAIIGAVTSSLMFFFFQEEGIVPAILGTSVAYLFIYQYYTSYYRSKNIRLFPANFVIKSKAVLYFGGLLSINFIIGHLCDFLFKIYLGDGGAAHDVVGYYEASIIFLNSYVGIFFIIMNTDYYPRLTAVVKNNNNFKRIVNNQIDVSMLLITPIILGVYLLLPWIIPFFFSADFEATIVILSIGLPAIIVKAGSWPVGFIVLSKGDKWLYFFQEFISHIVNLLLLIILYQLFGFFGIGLAQFFSYLIYGIYVNVLAKRHYDFAMSKATRVILFCSMLFGSLVTVLDFFANSSMFYYISFLFIFSASIGYSYYNLSKHIDWKNVIRAYTPKS